MAEGGSLLLDEIGEMPPYLQTKLLRVLQEREYRPIGSDRIVHVDFRLICATNIDLDAALRDGQAARGSLLPHQHDHAARAAAARADRGHPAAVRSLPRRSSASGTRRTCKSIAPAAYHLLIRNRWPGNVRELENAIERARAGRARAARSRSTDLPESIREREHDRRTEFVIPPHRTLAEIEKMAILQTLQRTNWNKQEAAQILGLYRPTLYSKMKKHEIRDAGKVGANAAVAAPTPAVDVTQRSSQLIQTKSARCVSKPDGASRALQPRAIAAPIAARRGTQLVETLQHGQSARGGGVTDNSRAMAATIVGAVVGGDGRVFVLHRATDGAAPTDRAGARGLRARAHQLPQRPSARPPASRARAGSC